MTVVSPCVSICCIDNESGYCKGCGRTADEVAAWHYLSDEEKSRLLVQLDHRRRADR